MTPARAADNRRGRVTRLTPADTVSAPRRASSCTGDPARDELTEKAAAKLFANPAGLLARCGAAPQPRAGSCQAHAS